MNRSTFIKTLVGGIAALKCSNPFVVSEADADDTRRLQSILDAGGSLTGGDYEISSPLVVTRPGTLIKGCSFTATSDFRYWLHVEALDCSVVNCRFHGPPAGFCWTVTNFDDEFKSYSPSMYRGLVQSKQAQQRIMNQSFSRLVEDL